MWLDYYRALYSETRQLQMMLLSGGVKVEHVRQKKTQNFVTKDTGFGVNVYELKETNTRPLSPKEDEIVALEHKTNQEIEVN